MRNILDVITELRNHVPEGHVLNDKFDAVKEAVEDVGMTDPMVHWNKLVEFVEQETGKIPMGLVPEKHPETGKPLSQYHPIEQNFRDNMKEWHKPLLNVLLNDVRF